MHWLTQSKGRYKKILVGHLGKLPFFWFHCVIVIQLKYPTQENRTGGANFQKVEQSKKVGSATTPGFVA